MVCRVCLKQSEMELPIFDESGIEQRIPDILQLHLWFTPSPSDPISKVICLPCWYKLLEFNQFYENAKEAHKFYSDQHKIMMHTDDDAIELSHPVEVVEAVFTIKREDATDESWLNSSEVKLSNYEVPKNSNIDIVNPLYEPEVLEPITIKSESPEANELDGSSTNNKKLKNKLKRTAELKHSENEVKKLISDNSEDESDDGDVDGDTSDGNSEYEPAATEIEKTKNLKTSIVIKPKKTKRGQLTDVKTKTSVPKAAKEPKKQTSQRKQEIRCWSSPKDEEMVRKHITLNCGICCLNVENYADMKKHFQDMHKNIKPYIFCCGKRLNCRQRVVQHAYTHEDPNCFQCKICKKNSVDYYGLRSHMLSHHPDEDDLVYQCDQCEKRFPRRHLLESHKPVHIPVEERKFMCTKCSPPKAFASDHHLNIHDIMSHKRASNVCHVCAKSIRDKQSFEKHVRSHFEESAPRVKCTYQGCDKYLKDEENLKVHLRRHVQESLSCDICGKIVKSRFALRSHKHYVHSSKKFSCNLCSKTFQRNISLKEHMASHSGQPLYACPFCTRTFNSNANMYSHKKKQHPIEWENWRKTNTNSAQSTIN